MFDRREFLTRTLKGSSLVALGSVVPGFVANTARAAEVGKDTILVLIEMNGGNDGLNTVIPFGDDLYQKNRPTLKFSKDQVIKVNDHIGLHPGMRGLSQMLQNNQLAIVQGVGYPNPDRSHFESMDIWQLADPKRKLTTGWMARALPELQGKEGGIPALHIGPNRLPVTLQGASGGGVISVNQKLKHKLELGGGEPSRHVARRKLLEDLSTPGKEDDPILDFVQRRQVQTLATVEKLQQALRGLDGRGELHSYDDNGRWMAPNSLPQKLQLVSRLIDQGFGTRVFYVMIDGFDTHSGQAEAHRALLQQISDGINVMFQMLERSGNAKRVLAMTFSEFGRRVKENGSKGTDHGAASSMFLAGPAVKSGLIGEHPSLKDLDDGDLKHHTDFRRVYATVLDKWLGCDSRLVLGGKYDHLDNLAFKL